MDTDHWQIPAGWNKTKNVMKELEKEETINYAGFNEMQANATWVVLRLPCIDHPHRRPECHRRSTASRLWSSLTGWCKTAPPLACSSTHKGLQLRGNRRNNELWITNEAAGPNKDMSSELDNWRKDEHSNGMLFRHRYLPEALSPCTATLFRMNPLKAIMCVAICTLKICFFGFPL